MKTVKLGELVAPAKLQRAGNTDHPVLSMTMHDGLVAQTDRFKKRIASFDTSDYKVVRRGQLVVGFPINEGVLDFQIHHDAALVSPAYGVWDLRDESLADRTYLKRFLKSPRAIEYYVGKMKGSTARRRSLPPADFNEMPIPLPPITEQRRIAEILEQADALRAKRWQVLTHLDALTQSTYRRFFEQDAAGHLPLGEIASKVVVGHVGPTSDHFRDTGVPFLRTGNVGSGRVIQSDLRHVTKEFHRKLRKSQLVAGDVLISRVITDEIRTAILPSELDGSNCANIILVRPSARLLANTILGYLSLPDTQRTLLGRRVGSAQGVVNTTVLKELPFPLYSSQLQAKLAEDVDVIERQRRTAERALAGVEELVASLVSGAFRGEV